MKSVCLGRRGGRPGASGEARGPPVPVDGVLLASGGALLLQLRQKCLLGSVDRGAAPPWVDEHRVSFARGRCCGLLRSAECRRMTAGEAITALQSSRDVEVVFYLYVIDARRHLVGVVSLRRLLLVSPATPLKRIMHKHR